VNSGFRVVFVADYSCEGSGGFSPRFPSACGVSTCQWLCYGRQSAKAAKININLVDPGVLAVY
jgi:hypothetical protein